MNQEKANPAMHFFLYLLHFLSLFFVSIGIGNIIFQLVNKFITESAGVVEQSFFDQTAVKFGIASILVATPLFFFTAELISGYLFEGKIREDSKVRKWLTYIVLFFAAATITGDLIALIMAFLNGDIAARFFLKMTTIFIVAGSIFGYYFWDIRREKIEGKKFKENRLAFIASAYFILAVFILGFFVIDGPKVSREKNADMQTVNELNVIDQNVMAYYSDTQKLPDSAESLKNTKFYTILREGSTVSYQKTGDTSYKLCAVFNHSNLDEKDRYVTDPYFGQWLHGNGKVCFDRVAVRENPKELPVMVR